CCSGVGFLYGIQLLNWLSWFFGFLFVLSTIVRIQRGLFCSGLIQTNLQLIVFFLKGPKVFLGFGEFTRVNRRRLNGKGFLEFGFEDRLFALQLSNLFLQTIELSIRLARRRGVGRAG